MLNKENLKTKSPIFYDILKKQFSYINIDIDDDDYILEEDFYSKYTWTKNAEDDFEEWLADVIYNSKEVRNSLSSNAYYNTKEQSRKIASEWILQYGFRRGDGGVVLKVTEQFLDAISHEVKKDDLVTFPKKVNKKARLSVGKVLVKNTSTDKITVLELDTNKTYDFYSHEIVIIRTNKEENLDVWKKLIKK